MTPETFSSRRTREILTGCPTPAARNRHEITRTDQQPGCSAATHGSPSWPPASPA